MADIGKLVVAIGADTKDLEKGVGKAEGIVSGLTKKLGGMGAILSGAVVAGAAAAAAAIASLTAGAIALGKAAFDMAKQTDGAMKKMQAQLGATDKEMIGLKKSALNVFGENFGNDINDVAEGIAQVKQQIQGLNDAELESVTKGVFALRDTFDVSLPEGINAVDVLMEQFGLTSTQALDFVASGFQRGLNSSDDFIDTIREYSNLFGQSGASAGEFFSILETGLQGGVLGTDKVADLFKEFSIRIVDGSKLSGESLAKLGLDAQTLYDQLNTGSITTNELFTMILDDLRAMDDQILKDQIGIGLFGTQWEDMGAKAVLAIDTTKTGVESLSGAADSLNVQYDTLGATWEGLLRKAQIALLPIGDILLNSLKKAMPQIERFFAWFQNTAVPMIADFVAKASDVLLRFFGNFDNNFGPAIERIERSLLMVAEALGLTTGEASGMDAAIRLLEAGLRAVVIVVDLWSRAFELNYRVITTIINVLRPFYDLLRSIVNLVPGFIGGGLFAASGGRTFQQMGFRARGGPVSKRKPYVVGERGPELFMPGASGSIMPNRKMSALEKAREAAKKWWATGKGKAYAASFKQPKIDQAKMDLEALQGKGKGFESVLKSLEKLGVRFTNFNPRSYDEENKRGFMKNFMEHGGLGKFKAGSRLYEDGSFSASQSQVTNNRTFNYSPTYNNVGSSNPTMDYYLMNSMAG